MRCAHPAPLPFKRLWARQGACVRSRGETAVNGSGKTPPLGKARQRRTGHTARTAFRGQRHGADGPPRPARTSAAVFFPDGPGSADAQTDMEKRLPLALRSPEASMSARAALTPGFFRKNFMRRWRPAEIVL